MNIHIPQEIINKQRILTHDEINIYNLEPHLFNNETNYKEQILPTQELGYPCFINTENGNIQNAQELNDKYVFYVSPTGTQKLYNLYILHEPEKLHSHTAGKSKKRKTKKSKKRKTKKNKTKK
tara:strand:+ start:447 stop:815 length:369 start_codon:yes stop_codon:yes gene_type:complete